MLRELDLLDKSGYRVLESKRSRNSTQRLLKYAMKFGSNDH